jgi:outer membrane protein
MLKVGMAILLTLGLLLPPGAAGAADLKVGIVDGMDIISKSADGKKVQDTLKRKSDELAKPLEQRRQEVTKMMADFEKQASVMKEDARKKKEEEINKKMEEVRRQGMDAERQFSQFQEKELAPIFKKLEQAVNTVAMDQKLDIVLDKRQSGLLYMNPTLDITEKVRTKFGP